MLRELIHRACCQGRDVVSLHPRDRSAEALGYLPTQPSSALAGFLELLEVEFHEAGPVRHLLAWLLAGSESRTGKMCVSR